MKFIFTKRTPFLLGAIALVTPFAAFAQTITNVTSLFTYALNIINGYVVPIIFAIAFVFFIFNVYRYFIQNGGNAEKVQEGQKFVLWSIIGFVIMFSIWGIINLFINTLGFGTSAQPAFPTFNGSTNTSGLSSGSLGSTLACLFGGCGTSSTATSNSTLPAVGSTYTDGTGSYTVTGANTVAPNTSGGCPSGYSLSGSSQCVNNSAQGNGLGNGSVPVNGACSSSADCSGGNECDAQTQTCKSDANGLSQQGDACTETSECGGDLVCDENSMTCQNPNDAGISEVGTGTGSVAQGGHCDSSADCQTNLECNTNSQTCQPDNGLGEQGDQCSASSDCDGELICDVNSDTCQPPNNSGTEDTEDAGQGGGDNSGGTIPEQGNSGS